MRINGAQALLKSLEAEGVDVMFGFPGGVVLPIYDAIYDNKAIRHILVRHEQGAAHAADGYARATGKVGVCMATSGPGATNLVTGIANAHMDSIPMVALTGQVVTHLIGTDAFQEADTTGITLPIVKHSYLVKDPRDLPDVVKEAFHIARNGRPGPVLIDLPKDISDGELNYKYPATVDLPGFKPTVNGHPKQIKAACELIARSKRPVLYIGGGVLRSQAWSAVKKLAESMKIPVTTTLMGKGGFPDNHELALGMPGMHGARYTNYSMSECDLIMAVGVRFDDRVTGKLATFAQHAKVIHIDIDPAEIGKNVPVDTPIVGDAKNVVTSLLDRLKKMDKKPDTSEWLKKIADWKRKYPLFYLEGGLKPQFVVEMIYKTTKDRETIIVTEVGQNQMWAAQFYKVDEPRGFISSGGLGTMGFGLPASIGAQIGRPDSLVIDIAGDGSVQMVSQELATAVANNVPIKIAILNNGYLGMVRQWQELFYNRRYSQTNLAVGTPDFVKLAEAYGAHGMRVTKPQDVEKVLKKSYDIKGPVVIDFVVDREENVFPMVAPGASIVEMLGDLPGVSEEDIQENPMA